MSFGTKSFAFFGTRPIHWLVLAAFLAACPMASGDPPSMTEPTSDAELRAKQKKTLFANVATSAEEQESTTENGSQSDFIVFDGFCTFVPKHAIIHVPEHLAVNVVPEPEGTILPWAVFSQKNFTRVKGFKIAIAEATGTDPIDPERMIKVLQSRQIVVAVLDDSPVSLIAH